ncbi:MAG: membrane protein insertion efficiency factor YidD [Nitrospiraceae bacterium]|nr:membrane protein insertion efficiency factor YidD [Nitrospiraceae bacterium]
MMRTVCLSLIRGYQIFVSPWSGPACRFEPTCSQYAIEAIVRYGTVRGLGLAGVRLLKCHPFHPGGEDPVR